MPKATVVTSQGPEYLSLVVTIENKKRAFGLKWNPWGVRYMEMKLDGESYLSVIRACGSGKQQSYRYLWAILAGGLEGWRIAHTKRSAEYSEREVLAIFEGIGSDFDVANLVLGPFMSSFPELMEKAKAAMQSNDDEANAIASGSEDEGAPPMFEEDDAIEEGGETENPPQEPPDSDDGGSTGTSSDAKPSESDSTPNDSGESVQ